jgi:Ca2+-binding EF-hand superfamily protein
MRAFHNSANRSACARITKSDLAAALYELFGESKSPSNSQSQSQSQSISVSHAYQIAHSVFDTFDQDRDGVISFREFLTGLSAICSNAGSSKVHAVFALYDLDGDGRISFDEMVQYLTSFFSVCFLLKPPTHSRLLTATPRQTAIHTAELCFEQADRNCDGFISFVEFTQWYQSASDLAHADFIPH